LQAAQERFEQQEAEMRERATRDGRLEADRRLRALTRFFRRHGIEIPEVKLLFHPVDYVCFRGMGTGICSAVEFIDREPISAAHEKLQRSIETSLKSGNIRWLTVRIGDNGGVTYS
jgi:predicted Holliday junction resolvase-like endonuclease